MRPLHSVRRVISGALLSVAGAGADYADDIFGLLGLAVPNEDHE